jgi:hypothetical protein
MPDAPEETRQGVSLSEAFSDIKWVPFMVTMIIGAPSLLSLLQMVARGFRLIDAFQWIIDGYNAMTGVLSVFIEPLLAPALNWFDFHFGWKIVLHPHWKPIFLILMVFSLPYARLLWHHGAKFRAAYSGVQYIMLALAGSIVASIVPLKSEWWSQGLIPALPIFVMIMLAELFVSIKYAIFRFDLTGFIILLDMAMFMGSISVVLFIIAAILSLVPIIGDAAGFAVLVGVILLYAVYQLIDGLIRGRPDLIRIGLTTVSGYAAATLVLLLNSLIKQMN